MTRKSDFIFSCSSVTIWLAEHYEKHFFLVVIVKATRLHILYYYFHYTYLNPKNGKNYKLNFKSSGKQKVSFRLEPEVFGIFLSQVQHIFSVISDFRPLYAPSSMNNIQSSMNYTPLSRNYTLFSGTYTWQSRNYTWYSRN